MLLQVNLHGAAIHMPLSCCNIREGRRAMRETKKNTKAILRRGGDERGASEGGEEGRRREGEEEGREGERNTHRFSAYVVRQTRIPICGYFWIKIFRP
jgi:hypothetical protein